jgi:hypothetical protein
VGTRVQHIVFDDLDHSTGDVATYRFALEGVHYEIDLSEQHLGDLRAALAPFITAGRRQPRSASTAGARAGDAKALTRRVRAWWMANAEPLHLPPYSSHGRVPDAVRAAYDTHH